MKRIKTLLYSIACSFIVFWSCNDDDVTPADKEAGAFLSRISRDGVTQLDLLYDIQKKLYRVNDYFNGTLDSYNLYEYGNDGIIEMRRYDSYNHTLEYRTVFTLDNFGRVIKGENYSPADFSTISSVNEFDYNPSGQLITRGFRSFGQPLFYLEEYTYDNESNLITLQRTLYPNQPGEYVTYQIGYTPDIRSMPDHWNDYVFILGISGLDDGIREMFTTGSSFQSWDNDGEPFSDYSYEASGTAFDGDGRLVRQVLTRKNILKPENPDVASEMTYEYVE